MYNEIEIKENVKLLPSDLAHIESVIQDYLKSKLNTCTKEYGYIMGIENASINTKNIPIIRHTGECLVQVKYTIKTLLPKIGDVYENAVVTHIYPTVVFAKYLTLQMIISLPDTSIYLKGDRVNVRIVDIRYAKKQYQCIGEI